MPVAVGWRCAKPTSGLREAMLRIAAQIADEGEYSEVDILSTPKSMSGGRKTSTHFKVSLKGRDNNRNITHENLIKIEHRDSTGHTWRFQTNNRAANYDYSTLKAKNGPPSGCPRNKRAQREAADSATQAGEQAQSSQDYPADGQREREAAECAAQAGEQAQSSQDYSDDQGAFASGGGSGRYNPGYNSDTQPAGDAQSWPDGWYNDPWANESVTLRWFENGTWTDHTK
ncbi:hypothetical protein BJ875DRAFT_51197 [Amylocarpus encephaloides]|uniref:Uncharacterized protein n=1 Tax=Amylocarpus encephaloides TaxID=45428 RepID=A0A9P8C495_9HELO|nr:hypothetical protein BJ875DRAFT_51197 [Amylocarpus encephaloides]